MGKRFHIVNSRRFSQTLTDHLFNNRNLLGRTSLPDLSSEIKQQIELKWGDNVCKGSFDVNSRANKKYVLSMFPYPSGNLHMGHVRVYTLGDAMAWYYRLNGNNVLHPIGFDAFGLPAENAAKIRGIPADEWTRRNIEKMRKQLKRLGFSFDWERELITCNPNYYKFTQYLFLLLYKEGLIYQKEAFVNWDPVDETVLANEQVSEDGTSWRSGALVEKRLMKQWFIETTRFAKQLSDGLKSPFLVDWRDITLLQQHWIGNCNGYSFLFDVVENGTFKGNVKVWTQYPEFLIDCSFVAVSSKSHLLLLYGSSDGKLNIDLINPINGETLPAFVSDEIGYDEGCDIKLVFPQVDYSLNTFAKRFGLKWEQTVEAENCVERKKICELAQVAGVGGYMTSSKLKDWAISRQRKWGTPIPLVHCQNCGTVPVPLGDLPILLPSSGSFQTWLKTHCPKCGQTAIREQDTMDTFVDSSWYFLRYLDPHNPNETFPKKLSDTMLPVDLYVGGKEHAVLHLYYARFFSYFLHSIGLLKTPEPFHKLLVQGMVMGKTYRVKENKKYIPAENIISSGESFFEKESGKEVEVVWEKMSKSKFNGVEPNDVLDTYGIDTTRLFILCDVSPVSNKYWKTDTFPGILNWQNRIWALISDFLVAKNSPMEILKIDDKIEEDLWDARNYYTKVITFNYGVTNQLSVAISKLQGLTNNLKKVPKKYIAVSPEFEKTLAALLIMISPLTPHFASELWNIVQSVPDLRQKGPMSWGKPVLQQSWPKLDLHYKIPVYFSVNNAVKDKIKLTVEETRDLCLETATSMSLNRKKVQKFINGCDILNSKLDVIEDYEVTIDISIDHLQRIPSETRNKKKSKSDVKEVK